VSLKWEEQGPGVNQVMEHSQLVVASGRMRGRSSDSVAVMLGQPPDQHVFTFDSRQEVEEFIANVRAEADLAFPKATDSHLVELDSV